ncbi:glutathione peroxidase [Jatrophihabitans fulvus]
MSILDTPVQTLTGDDTTLAALADGPVLVVNVASKCGLTPQYEGLQKLYDTYRDRGLSVVGVPCNQFMGQEPGTADEIQQFCSTNYSVTFPMLAKTDVNGDGRHPLYAQLTEAADDSGEAGDVQWNFEKFLLDRDGTVLHRFRPRTEPLDPTVTTAIEEALGDTAPSA